MCAGAVQRCAYNRSGSAEGQALRRRTHLRRLIPVHRRARVVSMQSALTQKKKQASRRDGHLPVSPRSSRRLHNETVRAKLEHRRCLHRNGGITERTCLAKVQQRRELRETVVDGGVKVDAPAMTTQTTRTRPL
jgi:hypothetical protein